MLRRANIDYQVIGGPKFYDRAEIKDAVAYLTFLVNPQDAGAFTRIANSPRRGIGQTSLSRVLAYAAAEEITPWEAAERDIPGLAKPAAKALKRFMENMNGLHERVESGAPVAQILDAVLHETGYLDALHAERTIEAQGRIENLEELVSSGGRVRHERAGGRVDRRVSAADLAGGRRRQRPRRRRPRDADDDPQREGARVPDRVHDRHGRGRLPALALDRGAQRGGGAPARLRRLHPRDARPDADLRARRAAATAAAREPTIRSRFLDELPMRAHRPGRAPLARAPGDRAGSRRGRARRRPRRRRAAAATRPCSAWARTSCTPSSARAS